MFKKNIIKDKDSHEWNYMVQIVTQVPQCVRKVSKVKVDSKGKNTEHYKRSEWECIVIPTP